MLSTAYTTDNSKVAISTAQLWKLLLLFVFQGPLTKTSTGVCAFVVDCKIIELPISSSTVQDLAQVVEQSRNPQKVEMQVKADV